MLSESGPAKKSGKIVTTVMKHFSGQSSEFKFQFRKVQDSSLELELDLNS
jgi:hypothetical protein